MSAKWHWSGREEKGKSRTKDTVKNGATGIFQLQIPICLFLLWAMGLGFKLRPWPSGASCRGPQRRGAVMVEWVTSHSLSARESHPLTASRLLYCYCGQLEPALGGEASKILGSECLKVSSWKNSLTLEEQVRGDLSISQPTSRRWQRGPAVSLASWKSQALQPLGYVDSLASFFFVPENQTCFRQAWGCKWNLWDQS